MKEVEQVALALGIPAIQVTNKGVAQIKTITVNELGISVGYQLPSEVHQIEIKGTFSLGEENDSDN